MGPAATGTALDAGQVVPAHGARRRIVGPGQLPSQPDLGNYAESRSIAQRSAVPPVAGCAGSFGHCRRVDRAGGRPFLSAPLAAQEITGLQAAVAIESALTAAIAQSDKSVVAIARVSRPDREELGGLEPRLDPFGALRIVQVRPRPEDGDFVPNDFATGVIIDRRGLILTNYHVLGEDSDYFVTTSERKVYPARIRAATRAAIWPCCRSTAAICRRSSSAMRAT